MLFTARSRALIACLLVVIAGGVVWYFATAQAWRTAAAVSQPSSATTTMPSEAMADRPSGDSTPIARQAVSSTAKSVAQNGQARAIPAATVVRVRLVAEEDGRPMPGIPVCVYSRDGKLGMPAFPVDESRGRVGQVGEENTMPTSGTDGWAEIEVPAGRELVAFVSPSKFGRASIDVAPLNDGERREVTLRIPTLDDIVLYGRLVAADDAHAIPAGLVEIERFTPDVQPELVSKISVHSDLDGLFRLPGASWRRDVAKASAPGFGPVAFRIARGHETPGQALAVRLQRAAKIVVTMLDGARAPVMDVELIVTADAVQQDGVDDAESVRHFGWTATSDVDGRCTLVDLPPTVPLSIATRAAGRPPRAESKAVVLDPGEGRALEIVIGGGATIRGRIVDQHGQPVSRHIAWGVPAKNESRHLFDVYDDQFPTEDPAISTTTDDDGRFRFDDVPPGNWWIGPAPDLGEHAKPRDPARVAPIADFVNVTQGEAVGDMLLRVDRGLYQSGKVVGPTGSVIDECFVYAFPEFDLDAWVIKKTEAGGLFTVGPLAAGRWSLSAEQSGGDEMSSLPMGVTAGEHDIVLTLKPGSIVRGRIEGVGRGALDDVAVWISPHGGSSGGNTIVEDSGRFEFKGLPPSVYDIVAQTRQGQIGMRTDIVVDEGVTVDDIVISLQPGAKLRIRAQDGNSDTFVSVWSGGIFIASSSFELSPEVVLTVPAGELRVDLRHREQSSTGARIVTSQTVSVSVGAEREVVFSASK